MKFPSVGRTVLYSTYSYLEAWYLHVSDGPPPPHGQEAASELAVPGNGHMALHVCASICQVSTVEVHMCWGHHGGHARYYWQQTKILALRLGHPEWQEHKLVQFLLVLYSFPIDEKFGGVFSIAVL